MFEESGLSASCDELLAAMDEIANKIESSASDGSQFSLLATCNEYRRRYDVVLKETENQRIVLDYRLRY